jgi:RNA polymerase sigma factor (sigma-70 family)
MAPSSRDSVPGTSPADPRARVAAIYHEHADFVVRIARQLGAPAAQLEDIVHDVFLVLHRRLADYDDSRASIRAWLYGITRNVVYHQLRSDTRSERRLRLLPEPAPARPLDDTLARARASAAIDAFLAGLDEDRRMVFALIDIEGMSAPEVAHALTVNINTVYSRLRLARQQFTQFIRHLHGERSDSHGRA